MSHDQDDLSAAADISAPTAVDFDQAFSAAAASAGIRRVWELAAPDLPPEVEPFSFVSADLLRHVAQALHLSPGQTLVDLGCGRGGPGLWLAREADVSLVGGGLLAYRSRSGHTPGRAVRAGRPRGSSLVISPAPGFPTQALMPPCPSTPSISLPTQLRLPPKHAGSSGQPGGWCRPTGSRRSQTMPGCRSDRASTGRSSCTARASPTLRWRTGPSGTTCSPASTRSPWTSAIPEMTPCWPTCKTRPGNAFP